MLWLRCETIGPSAPLRHLYKRITHQLLIEHHHILVSRRISEMTDGNCISQVLLFLCFCLSFCFSSSQHTPVISTCPLQHCVMWKVGRVQTSLMELLNQRCVHYRKFNFTGHLMICVQCELTLCFLFKCVCQFSVSLSVCV